VRFGHEIAVGIRRVRPLNALLPVRFVLGREPVQFRGRQVIVGVVHPQGPQKPLFQKVPQPVSGQDLDQASDDVVRAGVFPSLPGLEIQGEFGQTPHEIGDGFLLLLKPGDAQIFVAGGPAVGVGEPRRMGHQLSDRDGPLGRNPLVRGSHPFVVVRGYCDVHVRELREVLLDRIPQVKTSFLPQDQRRGAGDRFGHGGDSKDRIADHGLVLFDVTIPHGLVMDDFALPRQQGDRPGDPPFLDVSAQGFMDTIQAGGGQTHVLGRDHGVHAPRRGSPAASGNLAR